MLYRLFIVFSLLNLFSLCSLSSQASDIIVEGQRENQSSKLNENYSRDLLTVKDLAGKQHIEDIITHTPGLTFSGGTGRPRYFQLRGIGERSAYEGMPNESITILFDGIDYTGVGGVLSTHGLESLEIYKGPQNTVMGPSSLGGSLIATSSLRDIDQIKLEVAAESFSGRRLNTSINKALGEGAIKSATHVSLIQSDGYFRNTFLNRDDTNKREELLYRQKLNYKNWEFNLHYFEMNNGYDVFNLENDKTTASDRPGEDNQKTLGLSLRKSSKLGIHTLETLVSGHRTHSFYSYDEDWGNNEFWNNLSGWNKNYDYRIAFDKDLNNFNIEERLLWKTGSSFHTTGLFFKNTHQSIRELAFNNESSRKDLKSTFKRRRYALYQESEIPFKGSASFFSGLRLSHLDSSYKDSRAISLTPKETLWGGHFGVKNESAQHLWVLRVVRGFKAGGLNIGTSIDEGRRSFGSEKLYELDFTHEFKNKSFSTKNIFFLQYRQDVQVKTSYQDDPSDPSSFTFYTDNATTGKSIGLESSIHWRPNESSYELGLQSMLMKSEYGNYVYEGRNLKGREFSYAPEYKVTLTNEWRFLKYWTLKSAHTLSDNFYFGNSHNEIAPKAFITDFELLLKTKLLNASLYIRNAFNDRSETRGFFFGNRPPNFSKERFVQVGAPRIIGFSLSRTF